MRPLVFTRSTPLHPTPSSEHQNYSISAAKYSLPQQSAQSRTNQSTNNAYHGSSGGGHYGSRGRGGGYGGHNNRYNNNYEGEISASERLRQQIGTANTQSRYGNVAVYPASAAGTAHHHQQQHQLTDRQDISEPATIIWCEGGIGEVMSPTVWRNPNLHLYFDATKTVLEGEGGGWQGLRTDLEPGMEMDVTFTLTSALQQQLQDMHHQTRHAVSSSPADEPHQQQTHAFICIGKIAELRASKCSSVRTREQAVVIAKRDSGAAFLINNSGERTVLHPNFLPLDGVRHAILEKSRGQKQITISELDTPSSLCVLGRSLAVRLAPAPSWLPTIYPTDRGVTRWALSAEPYGEEKQGRAVVVKSTRLSISLCAVEGDLAGKRTTLHAPIIQMTGHIKVDAQEVGSCWRFRACRELPGRSAVWRAFELDYELDTDEPLTEEVLESYISGTRLIDVEAEEEGTTVPSRLDELSSLVWPSAQETVPEDAEEAVAAPPRHVAGAAAANTQTPVLVAVVEEDEDVLVFEAIDDMIESETFAADVFRAPSILPNEWMLLGVPPEEAVKTEQEMLLADVPRAVAAPRTFGVYATGDERPDMRVQPKQRKKRRKSRLPSESYASTDDGVGDEEEERMKKAEGTRSDALGDSTRREVDKEGASADDERSAKERKRELKEENKQKKHLAAIGVTYAAPDDDLFSLLHGGDSPEPAAVPAATAAKPKQQEKILPPAAASGAATPAPVTTTISGANDLFDLLHGGSGAAPAAPTTVAAPSQQKQQQRVKSPAPAVDRAAAVTTTTTTTATTTTAAGSDLFDLLHGSTAAAPASSPVVAAPPPVATSAPPSATRREQQLTTPAPPPPAAWTAEAEHLPTGTIVVGEPLGRPRAPRFAILPYPEQPRHEDGWWFRPTRERPPPVESKKEKRRKKREAEERARVACASDSDDASDASRDATLERRPADDLRARLLGTVRKEEEKAPKMENVLVDLSPSSSSPAPSVDAPSTVCPALFLPSPTGVHDDLKDLF